MVEVKLVLTSPPIFAAGPNELAPL
jgi:hypothetical protein